MKISIHSNMKRTFFPMIIRRCLIYSCMLLPVMAMAQRQGRENKSISYTYRDQFPCKVGQEMEHGRYPHNVIFIVGDGMGTAQVYSSIVARGGNSAFLLFPYSGFSRTYCHDKYTTDSGAGGTALMTGHKVDYTYVGIGPDGSWYPSFLTTAKQMFGMSAGFVVTSSVLDATPASTYAHVSYRRLFDSISMQMVQSGFDVMIGGGKNYFLPENRNDNLSLIDTLISKGYGMAYNVLDLLSLNDDKVCGLLADDLPPQAKDRGRMLALGTLKAIEVLNKNNNGFCLMVEGSQIDHSSEANDSARLAGEMYDFEDMLHAVMDFAQRDGNTLVIVTADHESGGLTLKDGNIMYGTSRPTWSVKGHTGVMVPVFAYGPGSEYFAGVQENSDFYNKIMRLLSEEHNVTFRKRGLLSRFRKR